MAFFGLFGGQEEVSKIETEEYSEIDSLNDLEKEFREKGCLNEAMQIAEYRRRKLAGEKVGCGTTHDDDALEDIPTATTKKRWFW